MAIRISVPHVLKHSKNQSFREWKNTVANIVEHHSGKDVDDLPDENYYVIYKSYNIQPHVMADIVLVKNGLK